MMTEEIFTQGCMAAFYIFLAGYAMHLAMAFARDDDRPFAIVFMALGFLCAVISGAFVQHAVYEYFQITVSIGQ